MRLVLVGAGRLGRCLLSYLSSSVERQALYELIVIERMRSNCREVANTVDAKIWNGDGTDPEVLRDAEAFKADLLVASTEDDAMNASIVNRAKKDLRVPRVIAVANDPKDSAMLKSAGADVVVCPIELAVRNLEESLPSEPEHFS